MAAGAVGGYFGGRLAAAGHEVAFIARGAHRDAIHSEGLKIESGLGDLHLQHVDVTDDPRQVGPVDVGRSRTIFPIAPRISVAAGRRAPP
jgi:2-dehydropantoate 2-reductase